MGYPYPNFFLCAFLGPYKPSAMPLGTGDTVDDINPALP